MNASEWTLAAIALAGDAGLSPVQLQKTLFLLGTELPDVVGGAFYNFRKYDYGPFAREIYADAEDLAAQGFVRVARVPGQSWNQYQITDGGRKYAEELMRHAPPRGVTYLRDVVRWAQGLSFETLVREIYKKYPEYRENSVFRG